MASTRNIRGISIEIGGDTTKLENSLKTVYQKSTDLTRELKSVDRALKFNPKNVELTSQKQKVLTEQVDNTRKRLNELKSAQAEVTRQYEAGEIDAGQYRAFQRELIETESILKTYERQLSEVSDKHKIIGKAMEEVGGKVQGVGNKIKDVGGKISGVGRDLTMKLTTPIVGIGAAASKLGIDFEKSMSEVAAVSGATGEELEQLEKAARDAGATTDKSARDAADALQYMALAGWSVEDSQSALMPVLKLSSAANMDLGRTSDLVTDTMSVLGLEIDDLEGYLDVLAQTSRNSNTDVDQLGESFLVVGGKLTQLGVEVEEGAVALGLLADNGIKGSEAGRGLNAILTNLTAPTGRAKEALEELGISAFDSNGEFIGIEETLQLVQDATGDMTQEQQNLYLSMIAGKEHGKTLNALMGELGGGFDNLSGKVSGADGALEEMYDTATDNTMGAINNLKSAIEELGLKIFENLQPAIEKAVEFTQKLTDKFNALTPEQQENIVKIGMMVAAIGPLILITGKVITFFGSLVVGLGKVMVIAGKFITAVGGIVSFLGGPLTIAIGAVIGVGVLLYKNWDTIKEKAQELGVKISEVWNNIKTWTSDLDKNTATAFSNMGRSIENSLTDSDNIVLKKIGSIVGNITDNFDHAYGETGDIFSAIKDTISMSMSDADLSVATSMSDIGRTIESKLTESDNVVLNKMGSIVGSITDNFDHAYSETGKVFPAIKDTISTTLREADLTVATKMSDIGRSISDNLTDSDNVVMQKAGSILRNITDNFDEAYSETGNSFKAIKMTVSNTMKEAATSAVTKVVEMKDDFTVKFNEIKSNTVTAWNNIKDGIMNPINKAKDAVKTAIDKMKGFFNFDWKLPKIKMPKFSVSGSANPLNWLKDGPPKLNVSWNAEGGILTRPGIFGMMGNTLLAGGEHRTGGEAILPLNRLPKLMADAMEMANRTQRQPMPDTVQQRNERPEVNVYQEIHSPKELDARESQRLARINMQQLAYQLGGV